jgi:hypothetical protein
LNVNHPLLEDIKDAKNFESDGNRKTQEEQVKI